MPYRTRYVKPAVFLRMGNVTVYYIYRDDNIDNGIRRYHYTTDPVKGSDHDAGSTFDVRELSTWKQPAQPPFLTGRNDTPKNKAAWDKYEQEGVETKAIRKAIRDAIAKGEIKGLNQE